MIHGVLVLLRHGESTANAAQEFTGLLDVGLTSRGRQQATGAARMIVAADLRPDVVVTSPMLRARLTTDLVQAELAAEGVAVVATWRLVERDYGCLTGVSKAQALDQLGPERYFALRRTVDGVPPPATADQVATWDNAFTDPRSGLLVPGSGESLRDVVARVTPSWHLMRARAQRGETVLVVAHGNSLRALCAVIDGLSPTEIEDLNIPSGHPLRYDVYPDGLVGPRGGRYLDVSAAQDAAARIAREGGT
ncbi:2,3-bisphosphoglycerate-dependent phosphoglycerate mutase [Cellulomonas sp. KRMCY2]|uniref:2,3-bisphosphoglycerate-dependent phosphoglycerate mutase n=1 Tax=Cellulomonas sp. KRMCY2 TaxID=1304865 RepID=UPI00045E8775|nr:2,3-bisphosphoglycerate-dependent phosphoglycerate mutase [Cellulomonas sp. KRMCY2]